MRPIRRSNDDIPRYFTGKSPLELLFCTVILKNCTFSSILPSTSLRFRPPFLENEDWNNITFICSPSATCRHGNGCKPLTTTSSWSLLWHYVIVYENFRWFFVLFFFFLFVFFATLTLTMNSPLMVAVLKISIFDSFSARIRLERWKCICTGRIKTNSEHLFQWTCSPAAD